MIRPMTSTESAPEAGGRTFTTIGVVGLGTMGAGIAEIFARHGYQVVGVEKDDDGVERGRQHLANSTARAVKREKITDAEQSELLGRISFSTSLKDLSEADLVVEAIVESLETKKAIFSELDSIVAPEAVLATNTSSLSVTEISTRSSTSSTPTPTNQLLVEAFCEIRPRTEEAKDLDQDGPGIGAAYPGPQQLQRFFHLGYRGGGVGGGEWSKST